LRSHLGGRFNDIAPESTEWLATSALPSKQNRDGVSISLKSCQFEFPRLAGGTIPFIRRYSTIWP
jgi:hypothetical protein